MEHPAATSADSSTDPEGHAEHQLLLRLLTAVEWYRSTPPERGLFREALNVCLGTEQTFDVARANECRPPPSTTSAWSSTCA